MARGRKTGDIYDLEECVIFCRERLEGLEIDHCRRKEPCSMPLYHYHDSYEIYYLLSGTRHYFIKDRTYIVEKGDIVLINRHDLHKTTYGGSPSHERILIIFDEAFMERILACVSDIDLLNSFHHDFNVIKLPKNEQIQVEQILFKIMKEAREKGSGFESSIRLSIAELLISIARQTARANPASGENLHQMHKKVTDIIGYINENYRKKITLNSISDTFYISPFYLSRLFKKTTGFTFVEYLNSIRIREAQRLLRESKQNVSEIAEHTGYESSTHFGRVFREVTGMSPLKYRSLNK